MPVKKKNGQIRCCIDFRNLNKVCPKDEFPLPNMDLLIDSTAGSAMFSFMDEFSGYNQIRMAPKDMEKTAFRTTIGNFYYTVMPFGLKNAGATYQRAMTAMGVLGLPVSVTQFSVSITHNSKMVRPMTKRLFGKR